MDKVADPQEQAAGAAGSRKETWVAPVIVRVEAGEAEGAGDISHFDGTGYS